MIVVCLFLLSHDLYVEFVPAACLAQTLNFMEVKKAITFFLKVKEQETNKKTKTNAVQK